MPCKERLGELVLVRLKKIECLAASLQCLKREYQIKEPRSLELHDNNKTKEKMVIY